MHHPGCPNPGQKLFKPESTNNNQSSQSSNQQSQPAESIPESEEKMVDGVKYVYCKKCKRGKGLWYKADHPVVHKIAEHKRKDQLLASTNAHTLLTQIVSPPASQPPPVITEVERALLNIIKAQGIPIEVLRASAVSAPTPQPSDPPQFCHPVSNSLKGSSNPLQFQIPMMDEVSDFYDCEEEEHEGPLIPQQWFKDSNLPPPNGNTAEDDVSTFCESSYGS